MINRVNIKNFRSIECETFECGKFNIFVGQNNTGKTNFFEAIEWFFNGLPKNKSISEVHRNRDINNEISVEIEFTGALYGASNMKNESNKAKIMKLLEGNDKVIVRRTSLTPNKRTIIISGNEIKKLPTGFDSALNDFLPKFEYVHTRQYFDEVAKYSAKSPVGIMLSSVLEEMLEDNHQYQEFKDKFEKLFNDENSEVKIAFEKLGNRVQFHLEKQFDECTKVSFEVKRPDFDDLLKNFQTCVDDGVDTYASEKGDGMQRALMLAIIQAYADYRKDREDAGKSFLFFIDEAELHLHPTAQRKLKNVLLELCEKLDQVFINTHSSVFVADEHKLQNIYKIEKEDSVTNINLIGILDKPYVVFELLGGSPADLLLPRNFLIVEGPSELEFVTRVIKRFYPDKPQIQIISASGDTHQAKRTINSIIQAFKPLEHSIFKERLTVLCDRPSDTSKAGYEEFLRQYKEFNHRGQIKTLTKGSIEECYPDVDEWKKNEQQVKDMDGKKKIKHAKKIGESIKQTQFENEMTDLFECLQYCWEKAF